MSETRSCSSAAEPSRSRFRPDSDIVVGRGWEFPDGKARGRDCGFGGSRALAGRMQPVRLDLGGLAVAGVLSQRYDAGKVTGRYFAPRWTFSIGSATAACPAGIRPLR